MNADKIIWHTSLIVQHFSYHLENKRKKKYYLSGKYVNLQHVFLIIPIFNKQIFFLKKKSKNMPQPGEWVSSVSQNLGPTFLNLSKR